MTPAGTNPASCADSILDRLLREQEAAVEATADAKKVGRLELDVEVLRLFKGFAEAFGEARAAAPGESASFGYPAQLLCEAAGMMAGVEPGWLSKIEPVARCDVAQFCLSLLIEAERGEKGRVSTLLAGAAGVYRLCRLPDVLGTEMPRIALGMGLLPPDAFFPPGLPPVLSVGNHVVPSSSGGGFDHKGRFYWNNKKTDPLEGEQQGLLRELWMQFLAGEDLPVGVAVGLIANSGPSSRQYVRERLRKRILRLNEKLHVGGVRLHIRPVPGPKKKTVAYKLEQL
ncbi:MAG: hypothetical protein U0746_11770 [Gemmataceae bacterium]